MKGTIKRVGSVLVAALLLAVALLIVLPTHYPSVIKAKEAVLREDLWIMRDSIQQFLEKHGHHPDTLKDLVDHAYIKDIPIDPITNSAETWITEEAECDMSDPGRFCGIKDIRSGAVGSTVDGVPYSEL